jgi:ubiquinone/menaquinone biosynthesis C-methylase UbiE
MADTRDQWAQWLLRRRHGGDEARLKEVLDFLAPIRERVLAGAQLAANETLLDVGCGDGLIAFGALEKLAAGRVIFSDISADLLAHCQALADQMGVRDRCEFVQTSADHLRPIADESVDVVTLRSVLIYVKDKRACFQAFHRVLKPGGRLSLFEPINRFGFPEPDHVLWGYDVMPVRALAARVKAIYDAIQPPGDDPMLDFDERDLLALAEAAGFDAIQLELRADIRRRAVDADTQTARWESYIDTVPNPRVPSLREAIDQALDPAEREPFVAYLRGQFMTQPVTARSAHAYLVAIKT